MDARHLIKLTASLQQPMRHTLDTIQFLLHTELNEEQKCDLGSVQDSIRQIQGLLSKLLDYARLEAGQAELQHIPFSLRSAIKFALGQFAQAADTKGIQLGCYIHSTVPDVLIGDPGYLRMTLMNLLENAVQFSPSGTVSLKLQLEERDAVVPQLHFIIQDQGVGMTPERLKEVFEPYFPSQLDYTSPNGGCRLDVATSKQIVRLMGGEIWAESTPNQGSTFHFLIPFQRAIDKGVGLTSLAWSAKVPALVLNDDPLERAELSSTLTSWDIETQEVSGVEEAVDSLCQAKNSGHPFGLVFIECRIPNQDGFAMAEILKNRGLLDGVVVFMMAREGLRGDAARCRTLGASAYLAKPFRPIELWEMIHFAVGLCQSSRRSNDLITRHLLREEDGRYNILLVGKTREEKLQSLLEQQGHQVTILNPTDACKALQIDPFDLVLMRVEDWDDWALELAHSLHKKAKSRHDYIPLVALTGDVSTEWHEKLCSAGVDECLPGLVDAEKLLSLVENKMLTFFFPRRGAFAASS